MKVDFKEHAVDFMPFIYLRLGECFRYEENNYMKVLLGDKSYGVNLTSGVCCIFDPLAVVALLDGEIKLAFKKSD